MKGVSTVIATILMLMITIALAGTAYLYISGAFTRETAVTLEVLDAICSGATITTTVINGGTTASGVVTMTATNPTGGTFTGNSCTIASLGAGISGSCTITRPAGQTAGTYSLSVATSGVRPVRGSVSCAAAA